MNTRNVAFSNCNVYRILKIGLPLLLVLFLGCTSFFVFIIDILLHCGGKIYHFWRLLATTRYNGVNKAKKCSKKQTVYRILKIGLPLLVGFFLGRTSLHVFKIDFC